MPPTTRAGKRDDCGHNGELLCNAVVYARMNRPNMLMKLPALTLLAAFSLSACAQSANDNSGNTQAANRAAAAPSAAPAQGADAVVEAAIRQLQPDLRIESVGPSPLPGYRQAIVGGQVIFVSDDGKYLIQGVVFDIDKRENVAEASMRGFRAEQVATIPVAERIVFAAANPQYTVTVFTDAECGYCRRFHQDIGQYNNLGISVEYVAFPRMGPASKDFTEMVSVWCASDRNKALTDAKAGKPVPARSCTSPVASHYALGQRIGLSGTPMILGQDGTQYGGYLPPEQLKAALDQHAKQSTAAP